MYDRPTTTLFSSYLRAVVGLQVLTGTDSGQTTFNYHRRESQTVVQAAGSGAM